MNYHEMKNGLVVMQAEDGEFAYNSNSANGKWKETTKFAGEEGSVLQWTGSNYYNKSNAGQKQVAPLEYHFEVDDPGTYYLTIRAIKPDVGKSDTNNDFFAQLENGSHQKIFFSGGAPNEFRWAGKFDPGHGKKKVDATYKITEQMIKENKGIFTLTLSARSELAGFDEIHIKKGSQSRDANAPTSKLVKGDGSSGGGNNNPPPPSDDNADPVAKNDAFTTGHNKTVLVDVLKNDSDTDGDNLSIQSISYDGNSSNVSISGGEIKVNPKSGFTNERVEEIEYTVSDGNGGTDTATLKVTVEAKDAGQPPVDEEPPVDDEPPANDDNKAPVAKNDTASTGQDKTITVDVLKNDEDPDGNKLTLTDVSYDGGTSRVSISDGKIKVNPLSRFTEDRVEKITYTVEDADGATDTATLSVAIGGGAPDPVDPEPVDPPSSDEAPIAKNDTGSTGQNKTILVDVLANDTDPEGGKLKIVDVDYNGTTSVVSISGNMIKVNPLKKADEDRVETITYTVQDEDGNKSTAVLKVNIGDPDDSTVEPVEPVDPPTDGGGDEPQDGNLALFIADAGSDNTIGQLTDGAKISAASLTDELTFFATSDDDDAFKFVELTFDGITKKETVEPYALFGDKNGDFKGGLDLEKGNYSIVAKGFDDDNQLVETVDIDFAIV